MTDERKKNTLLGWLIVLGFVGLIIYTWRLGS
jgi:hypothetical protein